MSLNPRPLHADESESHPNEAPRGFREWSQAAGDTPPRMDRLRTSPPLLPGVDLTHPLAQLAVVAFIGYSLGRIIHRHR